MKPAPLPRQFSSLVALTFNQLVSFTPLVQSPFLCLTSSLSVSWVSGQSHRPSWCRANVTRSCHRTPPPLVKVPWLLPTRSWWTWAPRPQTRLLPGPRGGGDGDDGDGDPKPGRPRRPVAPLLPEATEGSCWPSLHLEKG